MTVWGWSNMLDYSLELRLGYHMVLGRWLVSIPRIGHVIFVGDRSSKKLPSSHFGKLYSMLWIDFKLFNCLGHCIIMFSLFVDVWKNGIKLKSNSQSKRKILREEIRGFLPQTLRSLCHQDQDVIPNPDQFVFCLVLFDKINYP